MLTSERTYPLQELARIVSARSGLRLSYSQLWRWIRQGVRGHKLEARQLGRQLVSSVEALDRFSAKLVEELPRMTRAGRRKPPSSAARAASVAEANKALDNARV